MTKKLGKIFQFASTQNTDHDVLLQHFQSRGAIGLKQCMDHLVHLSLLLSRDRIPVGETHRDRDILNIPSGKGSVDFTSLSENCVQRGDFSPTGFLATFTYV